MTDPDPQQLAEDALRQVALIERRLAEVQSELDHTQRLATIGTLAAGVAHEVNNVLTPALSYAKAACAQPENTALLQKAVRRAADGIESASQILRAILEFAAAADVSQEADVKTVFATAVECLGRSPKRDGIAIQDQVPVETVVAIEPLALQQVFLNLLLNARRALRASGGGHITIRMDPPTSPDEVAIVFVDDGPGIAPEIADTLFKPFVSKPPETAVADPTDDRGGSGLGLTVCRRMIEAAGGRIVLEPGAATGATFRLTLPPVKRTALQRTA